MGSSGKAQENNERLIRYTPSSLFMLIGLTQTIQIYVYRIVASIIFCLLFLNVYFSSYTIFISRYKKYRDLTRRSYVNGFKRIYYTQIIEKQERIDHLNE